MKNVEMTANRDMVVSASKLAIQTDTPVSSLELC